MSEMSYNIRVVLGEVILPLFVVAALCISVYAVFSQDHVGTEDRILLEISKTNTKLIDLNTRTLFICDYMMKHGISELEVFNSHCKEGRQVDAVNKTDSRLCSCYDTLNKYGDVYANRTNRTSV